MLVSGELEFHLAMKLETFQKAEGVIKFDVVIEGEVTERKDRFTDSFNAT